MPTILFNGENKDYYKELLKIPFDMKSIAVVLVGKEDKIRSDAISSPTLRNDFEQTVTFIE